jgi:hypothetical protein
VGTCLAKYVEFFKMCCKKNKNDNDKEIHGTIIKAVRPLSIGFYVHTFSESVNKTSSEARLALDSCTVEYKQLYMCTLCIGSCSAWPKPILSS